MPPLRQPKTLKDHGELKVKIIHKIATLYFITVCSSFPFILQEPFVSVNVQKCCKVSEHYCTTIQAKLTWLAAVFDEATNPEEASSELVPMLSHVDKNETNKVI